MPQGDITFFPYDATVVVVGYLIGYFTFASLLAPRVVLTFRARARIAPLGATPVRPILDSASKGVRFKALAHLATPAPVVLSGMPHTSETALAMVQFILLAFFLYYLSRGQLKVTHPRVASPVGGAVRAPSFGVATTVTTNLVGLWFVHRDALFVQPAVYALFQASHRALHLLTRQNTPAILPRLLAVVRASKGIQSV